MKVQLISFSNKQNCLNSPKRRNNNLNDKTDNFKTDFVKTDSFEIAFKGIVQKNKHHMLTYQAKQLEKQAAKICKEAGEIRQDSFGFLLEANDLVDLSKGIISESKSVLSQVLSDLRQGQLNNHEPVINDAGDIIREFYIANEIFAGIFKKDNVSHLGHIIGAICGCVYGFYIM